MPNLFLDYKDDFFLDAKKKNYILIVFNQLNMQIMGGG